MGRDLKLAAAAWALVTFASIAVGRFVIRVLSFPTAGAEEASIIDGAFMTLTYLAAPVFGLVVAVLAVVVLRHRARGSQQDGLPLKGIGMVPKVWLVVTSALAAVTIVHPGLTGMLELHHHDEPGLEITVTGSMWQWTVEYPESGVKVSRAEELVLPADQTVRINVTSLDVLHSFWIPAFRQKIDAVPGQIQTIYVTPSRVGDRSDVAYRLQCAELCGFGHSLMAMPVRVVEQADFGQWVVDQQQRVEAK